MQVCCGGLKKPGYQVLELEISLFAIAVGTHSDKEQGIVSRYISHVKCTSAPM